MTGKKANGKPYKIGFIDLPGFYMDMDGARSGTPDFKSCTRDVRKILDNFNEKQVDAVIIDLRRNGGGALNEAISLTGLFIDTGPVVQVKDSEGSGAALRRPRPGRRLEGPARRAAKQVQRQRQRDFRRSNSRLSSRAGDRRQIVARQGNRAKHAGRRPVVVLHPERAVARRAEDHDSAVLSSRWRQHADARRRVGSRIAVAEHASAGRRRRLGLCLEVRPRRSGSLHAGRNG